MTDNRSLVFYSGFAIIWNRKMEVNMSENFDELGELGDRIKEIIDTAVSTKDYRQMTEDIKQTVGQTINSTLNSAVDTGSEAIRNGLNSMFGFRKFRVS